MAWSRKKKPEAVEPEPSAVEPVAAEPHLDSPEAVTALLADAHAACPVCGTTRTADVCPVDGFRFTQEQP
jgi:hypothetical protein